MKHAPLLAPESSNYEDEGETASPFPAMAGAAITGIGLGGALTAVMLIAYLLMPTISLAWTFVIAATLILALLLVLLRVPCEGVARDDQSGMASQTRALLTDQEDVRREEQMEAIKKLREDAVAAKEALAEISHDRMPLKWGVAMKEVGRIHLELAIQEKAMLGRRADILVLKQAVGAFRKALLKLTAGKAPQEWALTMLGLGSACLMVGERLTSPPYLEEAITAFTESLKVLTEEKNPGKPAEALDGITKARQLLAEIRAEEERQADDGDIIF